MCILSPSQGKPDSESRARGASTYFLTPTPVPTPQSLDQGTHLLSPSFLRRVKAENATSSHQVLQ